MLKNFRVESLRLIADDEGLFNTADIFIFC